MGHIKVRGIILRLVNFKDYDRYLSILTQDFGVLSVFAKGIRRSTNRLGSRCQLFSFADFELFESKGRYSIDGVETVSSFSKLQGDLLRLSAASQLAEIILDNANEQQGSDQLYALFVRACYELDLGRKDPFLITWAAEMKLMNLLGFQPQLAECRSCESPIEEDGEVYFDYHNAAVYCRRHGLVKFEEFRSNTAKISLALLRALRFLADCPLERSFSFDAAPELIEELGMFTLRFVEARLDKRYDKFSFFRDFGLPPKEPSAP
ncbi:MAG: DNA repair protein RecO [Clostridiaceae bacterium]|nr:DNA repair protein RecO [Clostridiaceae bacterium]